MTQSSPAPLSAVLPTDQAAIAYAKKWSLIDDQGQLWCIRGCGRAGQLPHLCCVVCIAAWRRGEIR